MRSYRLVEVPRFFLWVYEIWGFKILKLVILISYLSFILKIHLFITNALPHGKTSVSMTVMLKFDTIKIRLYRNLNLNRNKMDLYGSFPGNILTFIQTWKSNTNRMCLQS